MAETRINRRGFHKEDRRKGGEITIGCEQCASPSHLAVLGLDFFGGAGLSCGVHIVKEGKRYENGLDKMKCDDASWRSGDEFPEDLR